MNTKMRYVAFIPARGGSKGVPGKNIRPLAGKPLIAWSILQALAAKRIDRVVVSTDSDEIADIAEAAGAEVPFRRPAELADDHASTESAVLHFLDWAKNNDWDIENVVLIQCTSPIRAPGRFDEAIELFESQGYDSLLTVSPTHRFFWKNPSQPTATYDFANRPRRQDIAPDDRLQMETGSFYITRRTNYLANRNRLGGNIGLYNTPEQEAYEIDSELDFKVCDVVFKEYLRETQCL